MSNSAIWEVIDGRIDQQSVYKRPVQPITICITLGPIISPCKSVIVVLLVLRTRGGQTGLE